MLVTRRRLYGRDDLAGDAQLSEVAEARLTIEAVVADRLVQADQPLLDQVFGVTARQEVGGCLQPHEAVVAPDETLVRIAITLLSKRDQETILNLNFRVTVAGDSCHEQILSRAARSSNLLSGALLPWRQSYVCLRLHQP